MGHRRVLFINHVAVMGGAEYCLLDMAVAYRKSCQVLLFADGPLQGRLEAVGVKTTVIPAAESILEVRTSSGFSSLQTIPQLWQLAGAVARISREFEVIHTNSQKAFVVAALATLRGTPPVIWHLRDIMTAKHFSALNRRVAVALANRLVARVVVVSQAAADEFVAVGGREDLVKVVYDGIPADPFVSVTPQQTAAVREELGISDNIRLVGVFSRLSFWKGQHILVEAIRHLPNHVHGLFVGDALFGEDEYVSQFKALIADPRIASRVHWLGFRPDVPVLMSACDIVVHTSTEPEPCARMAIEGQLMQKPVVASAAGGMYEIIEDGRTGRLYPPGDASLLAQRIHDLLRDPKAAAMLAKAGQAHALKRFSLENHLNTLDRVIEDVVQQISRVGWSGKV
jgi:glycosyltransferase involved in cell wall biosynthesis